jgi:hypothetical protein
LQYTVQKRVVFGKNDQASGTGAQKNGSPQTPRKKRNVMSKDLPNLREELTSHILARTGRRLRNLDVNLSSEGVVIKGDAQTFYIKQLAQHGVLEVLPDVRLNNAIQVA